MPITKPGITFGERSENRILSWWSLHTHQARMEREEMRGNGSTVRDVKEVLEKHTHAQ